MLQPPLGERLARRVPWIVGIGIGWLVVLVGAAMLIVGAPASQWAPDPHGERRLRYCDGARRTDHVAD
ncbi:MAG TPA: hypothetical protein VGN51_09460 [Acidimicrobiia bacterium]|jgi:hypothetical protein